MGEVFFRTQGIEPQGKRQGTGVREGKVPLKQEGKTHKQNGDVSTTARRTPGGGGGNRGKLERKRRAWGKRGPYKKN